MLLNIRIAQLVAEGAKLRPVNGESDADFVLRIVSEYVDADARVRLTARTIKREIEHEAMAKYLK